MNADHIPPSVKIERERSNRLVAQNGWGATLRLKVLRAPVAISALILGMFMHPTLVQMLHNIF